MDSKLVVATLSSALSWATDPGPLAAPPGAPKTVNAALGHRTPRAREEEPSATISAGILLICATY